jgi:hypothetical protein
MVAGEIKAVGRLSEIQTPRSDERAVEFEAAAAGGAERLLGAWPEARRRGDRVIARAADAEALSRLLDLARELGLRPVQIGLRRRSLEEFFFQEAGGARRGGALAEMEGT